MRHAEIILMNHLHVTLHVRVAFNSASQLENTQDDKTLFKVVYLKKSRLWHISSQFDIHVFLFIFCRTS